MDSHADAIRVRLKIDVEHVNHAISIDVGKVNQVVDLLGYFFPCHQTERVKARNRLLSLYTLRTCLIHPSLHSSFSAITCLVEHDRL